MSAETLKPFIAGAGGGSGTDSGGSGGVFKRKTKKFRIFLSIFLLTFCILISCAEIWNIMRTNKCYTDVDSLKLQLEEIKIGCGCDIMKEFNEFREFKNEYDRKQKFPNKPPLVDDEEDVSDYDDNDEDDDEDLYDDGDDDEENIEDIVDLGSAEIEYYKNIPVETEQKLRKPRSITAIEQGIPIVQESYHSIRRRNRTRSHAHVPANLVKHNSIEKDSENVQSDQPKMYYDWSKKNSNYHHQPSKAPINRNKHTLNPLHMTPEQHAKMFRFKNVNQDNSPRFQVTPSSQVLRRQSRVMSTINEDKSKAFRQVMTKREYARRQWLLRTTGQNIQSDDPNVSEQVQRPQQYVIQTKNFPSKRQRRAVNSVYKTNNSTGQNHNRHRTIGIHFVGDTSKYSTHHEHYKGNGMLRHPGGIYTDWTMPSWAYNLKMDEHFDMQNGIVTIKEAGLYFVYVQIFYNDIRDVNGYKVLHNEHEFMHCATMTPSNLTKPNTCYTGSVVYLRPGDSIKVEDLNNHRHVILNTPRSFFGLVKFGDARIHHGGSTTNGVTHHEGYESGRT